MSYGIPNGVEIIANEGEYGCYEVDEVFCYEYKGLYYIESNSHCSCSGTWDDWKENVEGGYTKEQLIYIASNQIDTAWPLGLGERQISPKDSDYEYIKSVYKQILEHFGVE